MDLKKNILHACLIKGNSKKCLQLDQVSISHQLESREFRTNGRNLVKDTTPQTYYKCTAKEPSCCCYSQAGHSKQPDTHTKQTKSPHLGQGTAEVNAVMLVA